MSVDNILSFVSGVADIILIGLLVYRRLWRTFPVFLLYIVQAIAGDLGGVIFLHSNRASYATWYLAATIVDSTLLFGVLIELAWSTLRPIRASLSRRALIPIIGLILALGAAVWPFAALPGLSGAAGEKHLIVQLQQTVSILQVVVFLALVAGGQLLSIGWRDRELQIATGLGFFSFVSIAMAFLQMHETSWAEYRQLISIEIGASICCLLYWIVSFAQREAKRREFTPEMQRILLAAAGAAHATRVALTEPQTGKPGNHDRR